MLRAKASARIFASLLALAICSPGSAAPSGRSYFFANRNACAASALFNSDECAAAFANAAAELRDRAPHFRSNADCRARFRLCDIAHSRGTNDEATSYAPTEEISYTPVALGVEIVVSINGVDAAPTLAVDLPRRVFPFFPISQPYQNQHNEAEMIRSEQRNRDILAPDHFEPLSRRLPLKGASTFTPSAVGTIEVATSKPGKSETTDERRHRLKQAPLID